MDYLRKALFLCAALGASAPALAQEQTEGSKPRFIVRAGAAYLHWSESANVRSNSQLIPGGDARLSNNKGVVFDAAYFFRPNMSVALGLGIPPTTTLSGAGTLASTGRLGKITYGPSVVSVRYHLNGLGPVHPYVGVGGTYTLIFNTKDIGLKHFRVTDTVGPVAQGGFDIFLDRRFGIYFDAKKIWAKSNAKYLVPGPNGDTPGTARVTLNPLILVTGVSYRF